MPNLSRIFCIILPCVILAACEFLGAVSYENAGDLQLRPVSFSALPKWDDDDHTAALKTFLTSCSSINRRNARDNFGPAPGFGSVRLWQRKCRFANAVPIQSARSAKNFFEQHFQPYRVKGTGTFTGYYETVVRGSRKRGGAYQFPVYAKPSDLNTPYYTRAQIDKGALQGRGLEILYLTSAADAFLLHVQGSGAIFFPDGRMTRLSFSAHNGHGFRSISDALRSAGYDSEREGATMLDYRRWLNENPNKAIGVIQANPRYIFFSEHRANGPLGAQGVPLTPGRSLAVDRDHIGLGTPIYLDTRYADPKADSQRRALQRLVIAQDTGAAINGTVRGDFYWGSGETALQYAGRMKERGSYTLLLPK